MSATGVCEYCAARERLYDAFVSLAGDKSDDPDTMDGRQKAQLLQQLHTVRVNTGHPSNVTLARVLRDRGCSKAVQKLALSLKCDACLENKPKDPVGHANLDSAIKLWESLGLDVAEFRRPGRKAITKVIFMVDEGSRLCIAPELDTKDIQTSFNISGEQVRELYVDHWHAHYGQPQRFHTDPEGAFRPKELHEFLRRRGVFHDVTAGEAHWQNSIVERTISTVRSIVEKLCLNFPDIPTAELVQIACATHNDLERVRGFSPYQWALGRSPQTTDETNVAGLDAEVHEFRQYAQIRLDAETCFLKDRAARKLSAALDSRSRRVQSFTPGQFVFYWRVGKSQYEGSTTWPWPMAGTSQGSLRGKTQPWSRVVFYVGSRFSLCYLAYARR